MMDPIYHSTAEEDLDYAQLVAGLPPTEIGLRAHSLAAIRSILEIVKPKCILEIGFDRGHSSAMWLGLSDASVVSIDISDDSELHEAVAVLQRRYPGRLTFIRSDSKVVHNKLLGFCFDFAFIDGDHTEEGALADMRLAKWLHIPWVALDDWLPEFGPGVQLAASRVGFVVTSVFKQNIALGHLV